MDYYFYIIYSAKLRKYHVGSTQDLTDSLLWHNDGHSKFTKSGTPWIVVHTEIFATRVSAFQREVEVKKKKSKKFIEELVGEEHVKTTRKPPKKKVAKKAPKKTTTKATSKAKGETK